MLMIPKLDSIEEEVKGNMGQLKRQKSARELDKYRLSQAHCSRRASVSGKMIPISLTEKEDSNVQESSEIQANK